MMKTLGECNFAFDPERRDLRLCVPLELLRKNWSADELKALIKEREADVRGIAGILNLPEQRIRAALKRGRNELDDGTDYTNSHISSTRKLIGWLLSSNIREFFDEEV